MFRDIATSIKEGKVRSSSRGGESLIAQLADSQPPLCAKCGKRLATPDAASPSN
jgi:hypothetical protein